MKRVALCVGIDGYSNGIAPLNCAKNDAGRIYQHLLAEFDTVKYLHDFNASQNNIISEVSALADQLQPGDIFCFLLFRAWRGTGRQSPAVEFCRASRAAADRLRYGEYVGIEHAYCQTGSPPALYP